MKYHMDHIHSEIVWNAKEKSNEQRDEPNEPPMSAKTHEAICKRGKYAQLYSLCSLERRPELFQSTIPNWVAAKTTMKFGSERAQRIHKSIFEMLVMDLLPFHTVNKPGFLRLQAVNTPNFDVASDKYYRDMLDPIYNRYAASFLLL